jgi:hypothetical protein
VARASSSERASPPGTIGTPACSITARARCFEPIAKIALAGGPTNVMPAAVQRSANSAFSDKKP